MKALLILPGEWLFMWDGAACGTLSPNEDKDIGVMHKQVADEAVVVIKRKTDEDMVTYQRIKLSESTKDCKDEGRNMLT
jgi:hypothetical protein